MQAKKESERKPRKSKDLMAVDEQPLLECLVAASARRGDTLTALAKSLGVSYIRLAQWRRGDARIENARRSVLENAARYLDWPTLYVLIHAGVVRLSDLSPPLPVALNDYLDREIARMRQDLRIGPFVPPDLERERHEIRRLLVVMYGELDACAKDGDPGIHWLSQLRSEAEQHSKALRVK